MKTKFVISDIDNTAIKGMKAFPGLQGTCRRGRRCCSTASSWSREELPRDSNRYSFVCMMKTNDEAKEKR